MVTVYLCIKKIRYTYSLCGVISRVYIHNTRVIYIVFICVHGRRVHRVILFYCTTVQGVEKVNPSPYKTQRNKITNEILLNAVDGVLKRD